MIATRTTVLAATALAAAAAGACAPVEIAVSEGGTLAYFSEQGLVVVDPDGDGTTFLPVADRVLHCALSRDGSRLGLVLGVDSGTYLVAWDLDHDARVEVARERAYIRYPRWSPDGAWISFVLDENGLFENPSDPQELSLHAVRLGPDLAVIERRTLLEDTGLWHDWSADGRLAAFRTRAGKTPSDLEVATLVLLDPAGGEPLPLAGVMGGDFSYPRFSPDGRTLHFCAPVVEFPSVAYTGPRASSEKARFAHHSYDLGTGALSRRSGPTEQVFFVVPSPSGEALLYVDAARHGMAQGRVMLRTGPRGERRELGTSTAEVLPFFVGEERVGFVTGEEDERRLVVVDLDGNEDPLTGRLPAIGLGF